MGQKPSVFAATEGHNPLVLARRTPHRRQAKRISQIPLGLGHHGCQGEEQAQTSKLGSNSIEIPSPPPAQPQRRTKAVTAAASEQGQHNRTSPTPPQRDSPERKAPTNRLPLPPQMTCQRHRQGPSPHAARRDVEERRSKPPAATTRTTTAHPPPLLSPDEASKKEYTVATSSPPKQGTKVFTTKQGAGRGGGEPHRSLQGGDRRQRRRLRYGCRAGQGVTPVPTHSLELPTTQAEGQHQEGRRPPESEGDRADRAR